MSPRTHRFISLALPFALAVACTPPLEKTGRATPPRSSNPVVAPAKNSAPTTPKNKPRRPLQDWSRYWLTE